MARFEVHVGIAKVLVALVCTSWFLPLLWERVGLPFSQVSLGFIYPNPLFIAGFVFVALTGGDLAIDLWALRKLDPFRYIIWSLLIQHAFTWGAVVWRT